MGFLCGSICSVIFLILMLFIGAVFLRVACSICQVEVPSMLKSMGIMLATFVCDLAIGVAVGLALTVMFGGSTNINAGTIFVSTPLYMVVDAAIYMLLVPTSFYQGILIWTLWYIVFWVIVGIVGFGVWMLFVAAS